MTTANAAPPNAEAAILLCGHGSRDPDAQREFLSLAKALEAPFPKRIIRCGILEFNRPTIGEALDELYAEGVRDVIATPGMLFAAGHAKNDIPSVLNAFQARRPDMRIRYGRDLGLTPHTLSAAAWRIRDALNEGKNEGKNGVDENRRKTIADTVADQDTLLIVVGRGASDPDANGNVAKITRMLWEGLGMGWAETCYSGLTFPLVGPALDHAVKFGYRRIVILPYFLFTGVLVKRVHVYARRAAERRPDIDFRIAHYLGACPDIVAAFAERIREVENGAPPAMNCSLCKYREQIIGFEDERGAPQRSHHHHVEGGAHNGEHSHSHSHGEHGHDHTHHPYPHADHPLGPRTLIE